MRSALLLICLVCAFSAADSDYSSSYYGGGSSYAGKEDTKTEDDPKTEDGGGSSYAGNEDTKTGDGANTEDEGKTGTGEDDASSGTGNESGKDELVAVPTTVTFDVKFEKDFDVSKAGFSEAVTAQILGAQGAPMPPPIEQEDQGDPNEPTPAYDEVKAEMKLPVKCDIFNDNSDKGKATNYAVRKGIATGAGIKKASDVAAECTTTTRRGRRLTESNFKVTMKAPAGTGEKVKGNVIKSGQTGVLINSIKKEAMNRNVATAELLKATPTLTIKATVKPAKPLIDGDLTDGEIAAIVICVLIFFVGFGIGLWWANQKSPGPPAGDYPSGSDYGVPSKEVESKLAATNAGAYDV